MDQLIAKSKELNGGYLKKFVANIVLIGVISTTTSVLSGYFMMRYLQINVNNANGAVSIEKSKVNIWGKDYKIKERHNHK